MYYHHFGLDRPPFRITPDTGFFFGGGNRGAILEALVYAVTHGDGIIKVTGEVGTGKTMLCTMLQARLPGSVETVYVPNPNLSPPEMLTAIAGELRLTTQPGATRIELMQRLAAHLVERHAQGRRVVAFIEEAQSMPDQTLEEIRLLSNLETHSDRLLQIVLFGQPELDARLRVPGLRALRDRIAHSFRLDPLTAREIGDYLHFRLRAAGYRGPNLFTRRTVRLVARASQGLARRVNLIADKALLATFAENRHEIRARDIRAAVRETAFAEDSAHRFSPAGVVAVLLIVCAVAIAVWYVLKSNGTLRFTASTPAAAAPVAAVAAPVAAAAAPAATVAASTAAVASAPAPAPSQGNTLADADADTATAATHHSADRLAAEPRPEQTHVAKAAKAADAAEITKTADAADTVHTADITDTADTTDIADTAETVETAETTDAATTLLDRRLNATRQWLQDPGTARYSIQLMWSRDPDTLRTRLDAIAKMLESDRIFIYRIDKKQKPSMVVLYGSFDDRRSAERALTELPPTLKIYRPYLRTLRGIRREAGEFSAS